MRDDINNVEDLIRVIEDEVAENVIVTPTGGNYQGWARAVPRDERLIRGQVAEGYNVADRATNALMQDPTRPARQTDAELLRNPGPSMDIIEQAAARTANQTRFRQTTRVTPLQEGEPA